MALTGKVLSVTLPATSASVNATSSGFGTPDAALIFVTAASPTANPTVPHRLSIGFWDADSQYSICGFDQDNVADSVSSRYQKSGRAAFFRSFNGSSHTDLIGWSAAATTDGITLTKEEDNTTVDRYATVVLLKGATNKKVGAFTLNGNTSTKDVSDVGFKPDIVFAMSVFNATTQDALTYAITFGVIHNDSTDSITQHCIAIGSTNASATQNVNTSVNDSVGLKYYVADGSSNISITWSAFDANGFSATPSANSGAQVFYLALELPDPDDAYVAIKDSKTSTGTQAYTGAGFTPIILGLFGNTDTATNSTSTTPNGGMSFGWTDGTTQQSLIVMSEDAVATMNSNSRADTSNVLNIRFHDDTVDAVAAYSSFDSDGWTLNYSDGSASARKMLAIAIGDSTAGGTTLTAAVGAFTLSGTATGLTVQRKLVAEAASFTLTGNDSALSGQHNLSTASASFVLTGNAATLGSQKSIAVDVGEFTLTGVDSSLTVTRNLTAEPGIFGLLWKDAELTYGSAGAYTMPASTGNFALTGKDIITKVARKMPATVVSFTTTGVAASLLFGRKVIATSQSYTLQQNPANFLYKRKFLADTASFVLDRIEASLHYSGSGGYLMPATTRSFALTGIAAGLKASRYMNAVPVEFFLTGNDVKYPTASGDWDIVSDSANLWTDVSDTANTWVDVP